MRVSILMHWRGVWPLERPFVSSSRWRYEPLNSLPAPVLFNLSAGDLLSRASCFDSKSSREAGSLEKRTSDFEVLADPFFTPYISNVASSNFLSWLHENFLSRGESRSYSLRVKFLYYDWFYSNKERFAKSFIYYTKLNVSLSI